MCGHAKMAEDVKTVQALRLERHRNVAGSIANAAGVRAALPDIETGSNEPSKLWYSCNF